MTSGPGMRDLAHRLLAYEAAAGETSELLESPTLRVYEKLHRGLGEFVGSAAFQSLASRALMLAKPETPSLSTARISEDGSLQGLDEIEDKFDVEDDRAGEGAITLIARLLGLLFIFVGETLTLNLLRKAWPDAALESRNSDHWRKHE